MTFCHGLFAGVLLATAPPDAPPTDTDTKANAGVPDSAPAPRLHRLRQDNRSFRFKRLKDGSLLYRDPYKRYTATVRPNGQVEFADRWKRANKRNPDRGTCCSIAPPPWTMVTGPTEWLMYLQGQDPLAREKMQFLAQTFELRLNRSIDWSSRQIQKRLSEFTQDLLKLWNNSELSIQEKKRILFEWWDDCDERFAVLPEGAPLQAASMLDQQRLKAANQARMKIEAFIRKKLPSNSPNAYSDVELRTLNEKRFSQGRFAPYRSPQK